MPHPYRLLHSPTLVVDFFSSGKARPFVAFTFTPAKNSDLEGDGFAGRFLLDNGFDVIAFKNIQDDWYQNINPQDLRKISGFASRRSYHQRVAYGSSMGGFAAIAFSACLSIDRVLSISPQFDIRLPADQRWQAFARKLDWNHSITTATLRRDCRYFVIYDDRCNDRLHVDLMRREMSPGQMAEIRVPYSGHPSGYFLLETGQLANVARSILIAGIAPDISLHDRRRSKSFLIQLATNLMIARKYKSAQRILALASSLAPEDPEIRQLRKRAENKWRKEQLRRNYPVPFGELIARFAK